MSHDKRVARAGRAGAGEPVGSDRHHARPCPAECAPLREGHMAKPLGFMSGQLTRVAARRAE